MSLHLTVRIVAVLAVALPLSAQVPPGRAAAIARIRANYLKTEVRIPMRDGVQLFTAIYAPRDTTKSYPFMMFRTPSGVTPLGPDQYPARLGPTPRFSDDGFIFVYQDTRGPARDVILLDTRRGPKDVDESTDTYDTIDWLVKNVPYNNGRVGTWGVSAEGFFAAAGMIDAHPALKAASPQAPPMDRYFGDDFYHNGALVLGRLPMPEAIVRDNPDGYRFFLEMGSNKSAHAKYFGDSGPPAQQSRLAFWDSMMAHPNYDAFWKKRSLAPHLASIKPAVLFVGGWYDAENLAGPLHASKAMDTLSAETDKTLVVGPWSHGAWTAGERDSFGFISFGRATAPFFRDSVEFPFFACALKDQCGNKLAHAIMYETGTDEWRTFEQWPPRAVTPRSLYLRAHGALSFEAPAETAALDSYVSDPAKPVPYTMAMSFGIFEDGYPVEDQRFATTRPDVLVYQTAPLDSDLTLAGPIGVSLKVATSGTDADFIVKVIDVYPRDTPDNPIVRAAAASGERLAGYQQLVQGDVFRARWRESYSAPKPMIPGKATTIDYQLLDVFHTFKKGHRLMVHIQSTWFPLIDRNPQKYVANINTANESDFKPATMRVYRSKKLATHLTLPVLPASPVGR